MENIEHVLRAFWDKTRNAAELISQLREMNAHLVKRNEILERELHQIRSEYALRENELKKLKQEHAQFQQITSGDVFTSSEKEEVKTKIRDLIAKINSHL
ncbi:MAG: hypothetical protein HY964_06235 [Ignavibacteriales bacterium]|nr:hypothetical protein [Ignavibacteriales bacterium]